MIILDIAMMLATGIAAGVLSGLFGLGGGVVVVPILVLFFKMHGADMSTDMHLSVGTSLAIMIITTANSIYSHYRSGNIIWSVVGRFLPFIILGAIVGAIVSHYLHADWLRYFFMAFLVYVIIQALVKKSFTADYSLADFKHPSARAASILGSIFGFVAVLLGIGGSVLMVPYLRKCCSPMKQASAIAVAITPAVAIVGSISYIVIGLLDPTTFRYTTGYIYWPAFFGIGIGTLGGVPIGVFLTKKISDNILAKIYILLLVLFLVLIFI